MVDFSLGTAGGFASTAPPPLGRPLGPPGAGDRAGHRADRGGGSGDQALRSGL